MTGPFLSEIRRLIVVRVIGCVALLFVSCRVDFFFWRLATVKFHTDHYEN